jgi:2-dehydropantoate 2-reductase
MTSPDGSVVTWRGKEVLVSGLYPPLPSNPLGGGSPVTPARTFSTREKEAIDLWVELLEAGEGTVKTTDHVDSIRFSKVNPICRCCQEKRSGTDPV